MERGRHRLPALALAAGGQPSWPTPTTPLEEKFDTLRWVFSEREKDGLPFSFVSCLRVVGCSPLSPIAYCGRVDAEEVRDRIRHGLKAWLDVTLERYPDWVRDAVVHNPEWVEARLAKNPSGSTSKSSGWRCRATCLPDAHLPFFGLIANAKALPFQGVVMTTFKDVLCLLAIFVAYGMVGRLDYEDAVGLEQLIKERHHADF